MNTKSLKPLLFLFIVLPLLVSCSDDDDGPKIENSVTLNGQAFTISTASITGVSIDGEGHAGINLSSGSQTNYKTLSIDIDYSPKKPIAGTYSYPIKAGDRALDDFLTNYAEFNGSSFNTVDLQSGTVTVVENGGKNYTVTMDLKMTDGKVFKGTYRGDFLVVFNNG